MRSFILFFWLVMSIPVEGQEKKRDEYLRISYGGMTDKPIPELILFLDTVYVDDFFFGLRMKVEKCEMSSIQNNILLNETYKRIDTSKAGYYNIDIGVRKKVIRYAVPDKKESINLFNLILTECINNDRYLNLDRFFQNIIDRLY